MITYTGKVVDGHREVRGPVMALMTEDYCGLREGESYKIRAINADGNIIVEPWHSTPFWGWPCPKLGECRNYLFVGSHQYVMVKKPQCPMEVLSV